MLVSGRVVDHCHEMDVPKATGAILSGHQAVMNDSERFLPFQNPSQILTFSPFSKGTPTYPWSIPQTSPNPQMKGIPS